VRCLQQPHRHAGTAPDRQAAAASLTVFRPRPPPTGPLGRRVQPPRGGRVAALRRGDECQLHLPPLRHRHTILRPHPLARDNTRPGLHGAQLAGRVNGWFSVTIIEISELRVFFTFWTRPNLLKMLIEGRDMGIGPFFTCLPGG